MTALAMVLDLFEHARWADRRALDALRAAADGASDEARRELAHVVAAEEVWLARIEGRDPRSPIWPEPDLEGLEALLDATHAALAKRLAALDDDGLAVTVRYANSRGTPYANTVGEILAHLFLHGQYHRGKVAAALRRAGIAPPPVDYIAYRRERGSAAEAPARP